MTESAPNKQYMLIIDELYTGMMNMMMPHIKFVEIRGMNMTDNNDVQVLVTPIVPPPTETPANEPADG